MMYKLFLSGLLILSLTFFDSCTTDSANKKDEQSKPLKLEEKAKNTFKNTTAVFSGSMLLMFSESFKMHSDSFAALFQTDLNEEIILQIDNRINDLDSTVLAPINMMISQIDSAIEELSSEKLSLYEKMFLNDVVREGVAITEKHKLPFGFRPLSQDLSNEEIKRYILKVTANGQNMKDPIIMTYMELFEWFQMVSQDFNSDPEIQDFLRSIRE